jgi:hypothetical protein
MMDTAQLLADWLGEGGEVVDCKLSTYRALHCVAGHAGDTCPFNVEPNWWDKVKNTIAETIRGQLAVKNEKAVATRFDPSLHMCKICGCCLPLKVHVPIKHIAAHTPPQVEEKFPSWCWIRRELDQLKNKDL